jgi:hypothetical protein
MEGKHQPANGLRSRQHPDEGDEGGWENQVGKRETAKVQKQAPKNAQIG